MDMHPYTRAQATTCIINLHIHAHTQITTTLMHMFTVPACVKCPWGPNDHRALHPIDCRPLHPVDRPPLHPVDRPPLHPVDHRLLHLSARYSPPPHPARRSGPGHPQSLLLSSSGGWKCRRRRMGGRSRYLPCENTRVSSSRMNLLRPKLSYLVCFC